MTSPVAKASRGPERCGALWRRVGELYLRARRSGQLTQAGLQRPVRDPSRPLATQVTFRLHMVSACGRNLARGQKCREKGKIKIPRHPIRDRH